MPSFLEAWKAYFGIAVKSLV